MASPDRIVLVDGSSLMYRAFFALPGTLSTTSGLQTNAIFGFATMFRKLMSGRTPRYGAVVFDAPGPTFRSARYPQYKAQRPRMPRELRTQIPHIHRLVEAWRFPLLSVGGIEADDVIGTLTRQAVEAGIEVHIIAGDKDFAQLIGDGVRMVDTMRDVTYDAELVRKKWGVPPASFVDFLALVGDKVDNIPGIAGVGPKSATKLLEQYGDLEGVLAHAHEVKGKLGERLVEYAEDARTSRELARIDQHAPLPLALDDLVLDLPEPASLNEVYRELEFYSLLTDDQAGDPDTGEAPRLPASAAAAAAAVAELASAGRVAIYPVHEDPSAIAGALVGLAFAVEGARPVYVAIRGPEGALGEASLTALAPFLEDADAPKLAHDAKAVEVALARRGVQLRGVTLDTRLASFLVDPTGITPHRLSQVVKQYLFRALPPEKGVVGSGKAQRRWEEVAVAEVAAYAGHLAAEIAALAGPVGEALGREGQERNHDELMLPLSGVLARMERAGIRVDAADIDAMGVEFRSRKAEIEAEIFELAGHEFNVDSTKQLATVLFDELGLPVLKKTKTNYSTAQDVLERLAPKHPIAGRVLDYRALAKLISTYTDVLAAAIAADGRVHPTWVQTTGASGRLISTDPDLQRTPVRTAEGKRIRRAFVAEPGHVLISADWSQIELRILAHFSEDPLLVAAFAERIDVHRQTASRLFDVAPDEVSDEQRNVGKTVNFATIYGQGATALSQSLRIPRNTAAAYIEAWFTTYAGVRAWLDDTIATANVLGHVETILGRRRYIPELASGAIAQRLYGERIAANTPIQGSAADLCMLAMLGLDVAITERGMGTRMLLQIHDELVFEAPEAELDAAVALIRQQMQGVWPLRVPLVVDVGVGPSWAAAH